MVSSQRDYCCMFVKEYYELLEGEVWLLIKDNSIFILLPLLLLPLWILPPWLLLIISTTSSSHLIIIDILHILARALVTTTCQDCLLTILHKTRTNIKQEYKKSTLLVLQFTGWSLLVTHHGRVQ